MKIKMMGVEGYLMIHAPLLKLLVRKNMRIKHNLFI